MKKKFLAIKVTPGRVRNTGDRPYRCFVCGGLVRPWHEDGETYYGAAAVAGSEGHDGCKPICCACLAADDLVRAVTLKALGDDGSIMNVTEAKSASETAAILAALEAKNTSTEH